MNAILEIIKMLNEGKKNLHWIATNNKDNSDAMLLYAGMLYKGDEIIPKWKH